MDHFFVSEQQPPQLCTMDLPWHTIYDVLDEPPSANQQHAPGGPLCTQAGGCSCRLQGMCMMQSPQRPFRRAHVDVCEKYLVCVCVADSRDVWQAEAQRLAGILAAFPTTEQQDQELLDSGILLDWRERVIVRFRMLRKEALRLTIQGIEAALAKGRPKPVELLEGASDKLQEPLFIQIGSGNVAEL